LAGVGLNEGEEAGERGEVLVLQAGEAGAGYAGSDFVLLWRAHPFAPHIAKGLAEPNQKA